MGGFFNGLAAAAGGFGEAAQPHNDKLLSLWEDRRKDALGMLDNAIKLSKTPEMQQDLYKLRNKVSQAKPGVDPTPLLQELNDRLMVHPTAASQLAPPPPKPQAGPAAPGTVPGSLQTIPPPPSQPVNVQGVPQLIDRAPMPPPPQTIHGMEIPEPSATIPAGNPLQGGGGLNLSSPPQGQGMQQLPMPRAQSPTLQDMQSNPYPLYMPSEMTLNQPLIEAESKNWLEQQKPHEVSGYLVSPDGSKTLWSPPPPPRSTADYTIGNQRFSGLTNQVVATGEKTTNENVQVVPATDANGNLTITFVDRNTKEISSPIAVTGPGGRALNKPISPGSFQPIYQDNKLVGLYNGKSNELRTPNQIIPGAGTSGDNPPLRTTPLQTSEVTWRTDSKQMLEDIKRLTEVANKNKDKVGIVAGTWGELENTLFGEKDPTKSQEITDLYGLADRIKTTLLHADFGSAQTNQEMKNLAAFIADPTSANFNTFISRLNTIRQRLNSLLAIRTGADNSGNTSAPAPTSTTPTGDESPEETVRLFKEEQARKKAASGKP